LKTVSFGWLKKSFSQKYSNGAAEEAL